LSDTRGTRYVFPEDLPPVPPKGIVLVTFQGPASPPNDDKDFSSDNVAKLFVRTPHATNYFAGQINECALYASPDANGEDIVEYLCWGDYPDSEHAHSASDVRLWSGRRALVTIANRKPGDYFVLQEGGSLGRMAFRKPVWDTQDNRLEGGPSGDWLTYIPEETTPGRKNKYPSPIPFIPHPDSHISPQGACTGFQWIWQPALIMRGDMALEWNSHLQVAGNPNFERLIIDSICPGTFSYAHPSPLEPGRYYWRVREERNGETTPWSPTGTFVINPF